MSIYYSSWSGCCTDFRRKRAWFLYLLPFFIVSRVHPVVFSPWFESVWSSAFRELGSGLCIAQVCFDMVPGVFRSPVSLNHCFCVRFPTALRFFQTFWFRFGRPRRKDGLQPHPRLSWVSVHCFPIAGTLSRVLLGGFAFLVFLFGAIHCRADSVRFTLSLYFCTSIP